MCQIPVRHPEFWVRWKHRRSSDRHRQTVCYLSVFQLRSHTRLQDSSSVLFSTSRPVLSKRELPVLTQISRRGFTSQCCGMVKGEMKRVLDVRAKVQWISQTTPLDQRPQKKSCKKLQAVICVLLVELCERFTFFGIVCNMILFCTVKLGYDNYLAATINLCFIGATTLTPVLVGWFAETCLGRNKILYLCAFLHFFGKREGRFLFLLSR